MMNLTKYLKHVILVVFVAVMIFTGLAYAVEITPDIGFRQYQTPNGSEYDPNAKYRAQILHSKNNLNDKIFSDNNVTKAIPNFDSIGLNFTFKMD